MIFEIHMLKSYPPTNLNRDDTGAPKTCVFGNATRGRISSQCLKRSWRTSEIFKNEVGVQNLGIRTRKFPELVVEQLKQLGVSEQMCDAVMPRLSGFGNKDGKENTKDSTMTAQVIFYAPEDIVAAAEVVKQQIDGCASVKQVEKLKAKDLQDKVKGANERAITLDMAMFGRMVTSDAFRDVEAAVQVAHAISTNKVVMESDYFTAMDDLLCRETMEDSGSAMIGDIDYNASCYYIYAAVDTDILAENLKYTENAEDLIQKTVPALLRAMAFSNPSGKQNSFAGHSLPSAIYVECKKDKIPVNLSGAFVEPVRPQKERDLVCSSIHRLTEEIDMVERNFAIPTEKKLWFCVDKYQEKPDAEVEHCKDMECLLHAVADLLK